MTQLEVKGLDGNEVKDSTLILQLLRDNLTVSNGGNYSNLLIPIIIVINLTQSNWRVDSYFI